MPVCRAPRYLLDMESTAHVANQGPMSQEPAVLTRAPIHVAIVEDQQIAREG